VEGKGSDWDAIDRLVDLGHLPEAADRAEAMLAGAGADLSGWLRLAGMRKALRQPRRALRAVDRALALAPLDFVALALRASLLERMSEALAGEAWGEALAQRPAGDLPPALAAAVSAGERLHARWQAARGEALQAATADAERAADPDAAARIARFRRNVLRETRPYHSEPTHFHYPGLAEREFHPRHRFPWLAELEAATDTIRGELEALLASQRGELMPYIQYEEREALAQWRGLNHNPDWTAVHLLQRGQRIAANADACPVTMRLLERVPQPLIPGASPNAMFSLLAPRTSIPPHVGVNNARLLCHLPLIVPEGCWFRVGAETRPWREGEAFVFDDTIEHEAANPSDRLRVVMIFDLWHPDLALVEQDAVAALIAADGGYAARHE